MSLIASEFVHPIHISAFIEAAKTYHCHILVRKTGNLSVSWIGKTGYTGKRGDMKAKTANLDTSHKTAGLVCSPILQPGAFTADRLGAALKEWNKSKHLITEPQNGFDDKIQPRGCPTPYIVQTNRKHQHFGCIALVEMGLLMPRYVHGDYDLYAIIPSGEEYNPDHVEVHKSTLGSTMLPDKLGLEEKLNLAVLNFEGPLSFKIANYINTRIEQNSRDLLGALMVNHGEQVNLGKPGQTYEPVLALTAFAINGRFQHILVTQADHTAFYKQA